MWNNILNLSIKNMLKKKTKILAIDPGTKIYPSNLRR